MFTYIIKLPSEIASAFLWSMMSADFNSKVRNARCTSALLAAQMRRRRQRRRDITAGTCSPVLFLPPSNKPFQSGALIRLRCSTLHLHTHMLLTREAAARRRLAVFGAGWQQALSINGEGLCGGSIGQWWPDAAAAAAGTCVTPPIH